MSTTISSLGQSSAAATKTPTLPQAKDPLADKTTFLRLLVSQLKNQNPLSPVDGNQFVSQLTSYSQLEQLIGIHQDTTALGQPPTSPATPSSASSSSTGR